MPRSVLLSAALCALVSSLYATAAFAGAIVADHTVVDDFEHMPESVVELAKNEFTMFYGHTSHGSQIITGLWVVRDEDPLFDFNNGPGTFQFEEYSDDLGHNGDTSWVPITRDALDEPGSEINLVMWSWCGGCSDNTEEGINTYLDAMDQLEVDYPDVRFVYMTGHLDGTGPSGNLYARNNQIRDYCEANGKVLFDFADIESYDPAGTWYPDETDLCNWCYAWCDTADCPWCSGCAHSHCFNCYRKGKAFWWMLGAMVTGMEAGVDSGPADATGPHLAQNRPNPFSPSTEIGLSLPEPSRVTVEVYTLAGRKVKTLADCELSAGDHALTWDGTDERGRPVAAGAYFCAVRTADGADARKMVLLR